MWGRLGLQEMPTPASTEHSRASLTVVPSPAKGSSDGDEEPLSPLAPRNLFGPREEDSTREEASATEDDDATEDAAPGVEITISAEGYADDTYMLTVALLSLVAMVVAANKWLKLTGQEINAKKSLAFSATNSTRGKPEAMEATLDGVLMPVQQEFRQLGVGVRTLPRRGTGPLLQRGIREGKTAPKKARTLPGGFEWKATVAAVMIVAVALFGVELADISLRDISGHLTLTWRHPS